MIKKYILPFFALVANGIFAQQIPQYYNNIDFKQSKENIKQQITYKITSSHHEIGYREVWDVLDRADEDPENKNNVLLIYGHPNYTDDKYPVEKSSDENKLSRSRKKEKKHKGGSGKGLWNREHVFVKALASPKLIGSGNKIDAGSDAHNLRAADSRWNSTRNDRVFADAQGVSKTIGKNEWYPGDEWKGDVARIIMYMYVRYGTRTKPNNIGSGGNALYKVPDMPDIFLKWNREDPPSDFEIRRNDEIFYTQQNRNPFIDNPYLATIIWGGEDAQDTWNLKEVLNSKEVDFNDMVKIYPARLNSNEFLNFTSKVHKIEFFNMAGQRVKHYENTTNKVQVPYEKGVYIVRYLDINNNKIYSKKIIVN